MPLLGNNLGIAQQFGKLPAKKLTYFQITAGEKIVGAFFPYFQGTAGKTFRGFQRRLFYFGKEYL
jgi:hypothetical protein